MLSKTIFLAFLFAGVYAEEKEQQNSQRDPKLSIFQVVKFANSECTGGTRNGTCFTRAECDNLGGTSSSSCADGFGVCCLVVLTTGQTSAVNNTYLTLSTTDVTAAGSYTYTVCPCSDDICRIKFDFIDFTLEGPNSGVGTVVAGGATVEVNLNNVGTCTSDSFQIISPSGRSSPLICGENANQHMLIDGVQGQCHSVNLGLGASATVTRSLNIRVTQYRCGEESGGPPGCLQYYENTSGKIRSFNFPDASPGTTLTYNYATHLVNQQYKICIRRGNGYEVICYIACTDVTGGDGAVVGDPVTAQSSFGLSVTSIAGSSDIDTQCSTDYLWIPLGMVAAEFTTANSDQDGPPGEARPVRFCGAFLATDSATYATQSICSYAVPFEVGVSFDDQEDCTDAATSLICESTVLAETGGAGGILGFSLCYIQHIPPVA